MASRKKNPNIAEVGPISDAIADFAKRHRVSRFEYDSPESFVPQDVKDRIYAASERGEHIDIVPAENFVGTLAANVDNKDMSDEAFRAFVRQSLPIVKGSNYRESKTTNRLS